MTAKKKKAAATAAKKPNALEFCRVYLRKKPSAAFSEIRDAAANEKLTLYPVSYGRAKALEGLVEVRPYGSKKKVRTPARRGPGRPKGSKNKRGAGRPKRSSKAGPESIESLVSTIQQLQRERDEALDAIDEIRRLLDSL